MMHTGSFSFPLIGSHINSTSKTINNIQFFSIAKVAELHSLDSAKTQPTDHMPLNTNISLDLFCLINKLGVVVYCCVAMLKKKGNNTNRTFNIADTTKACCIYKYV